MDNEVDSGNLRDEPQSLTAICGRVGVLKLVNLQQCEEISVLSAKTAVSIGSITESFEDGNMKAGCGRLYTSLQYIRSMVAGGKGTIGT